MRSPNFAGNRLAFLAGIGAATLGLLMLVGGIGLALAVVSSPQPGFQIATALLLAVVGLVNLWAARRIGRTEPRALVLSGAATTLLILYLGVALRDFGEPLWAHAVYLLVLLGLGYRVALDRRAAA